MVHACLLAAYPSRYILGHSPLASHPQWKSLESRDRPEMDRWTRLANPYDERMHMSGWAAEGREEVPEGE